MSNQNKAQKATIAEIKDKFFEIPTYQRLYEWESIHIEILLDDMKKAWKLDDCQSGKSNADSQKSSKQYFIGNITTSIDKNDNNKFILIDGQQRLTTLWFIGFYLASKDCGEWQQKWKEFIFAKPNDKQDKTIRISMPIRDKEREALENLAKKIQKSEIKPNKEEKLELSKDLQGIHQKIIDAFDCIESWFVGENGKDIDLAKFAECIFKKVCFVFVELAQKTDLNRFFVRMNNRGKQLEKHEILKARMLGEIRKKYDENGKLIKDTNDTIWEKYAKIWDLCSDMNKYIFQSTSDRNIFGNSKNKKEQDNSGQSIDEIINNPSADSNNSANKDDDTPDKVESIIDFPTFLLHCYKLWVAKKCNDKVEKITITKDKLLEIMWDNQTNNGKNKEVILDDKFIFNDKNNKNGQAKANCKEFIESMLCYRVLFDYFVIKDDVRARSGNNYKIMRLSENQGNYNLPENSKKGELTSGVLHDLTMTQNYLRVARQGERQNYHHWLTPFLAYLEAQKDKILVLEKSVLDLDFAKWKTEKEENKTAECEYKTNLIAKRFSEYNDKNWQNDLIAYLSKLDTALSKEQLGANSENKLLLIANEAIQATFQTKTLKDINWNFKSITDEWKQYATKDNYKEWNFLNNGTGTPHYWFYRLEYYLWKWGNKEQRKDIKNDTINKIFKEFDNLEFPKDKGNKFKFDKILGSFYFRNLNSVEHIEPQSNFREDKKYEWTKENIDCFGNLALLSVGFNSALSNQDNADKRLDLQKKINKSEVESLKLWLVFALYIKDGNEWTYENAQKHQNQMFDILIESLKKS